MELASVVASDGYVLRYRVWPNQRAKATLVLVNGVMSHSLWFQPVADRLIESGLRLVGADRRGSGPNLEARGDAPSGDQLVDDLALIIDHHRGALPLFLLGWCWGAVLALNTIHRVEARGLILVASGLHPTAEVSVRAREAERVAASTGDAIRVPIDEGMFTDGPLRESFIEKDDARVRYVTPRFRKAMDRLAMKAAGTLRRVQVPILGIAGTRDRATDSETALAALDRLDPSRVRKVLIEGSHGLMFDAPAALADAIARWVGDHV